MLKISHLFIYPIKSLGGIELTSSVVEERGLQYDRRWMLVDEQNRFITQREHSQLALFRTAISSDHLEVFHLSDPLNRILIPLQYDQQQRFDVTVWDDVCPAVAVSIEADQWFSQRLHQSVRLVYMPETAEGRSILIMLFSRRSPVSLMGIRSCCWVRHHSMTSIQN
jgi:uncharacterized protein YcbX